MDEWMQAALFTERLTRRRAATRLQGGDGREQRRQNGRLTGRKTGDVGSQRSRTLV